jgi:hypothetical protein
MEGVLLQSNLLPKMRAPSAGACLDLELSRRGDNHMQKVFWRHVDSPAPHKRSLVSLCYDDI